MENYKFGPAAYDEKMVFGAQRPGYDSKQVTPGQVAGWIDFLQGKGIQRVCCLLNDTELAYYPHSLLDQYKEVFDEKNVCFAGIEDFQLVDKQVFHQKILPFLVESVESDQPVVVHCSGGSGRTGHVLAGWLVYGCGFGAQQALNTVRELGRNPYEAIDAGNASIGQLLGFLTPPQLSEKA